MRTTIFKTLVGIAGVYHLVLGFSGLFLPMDMFMEVSERVLGVRPEANDQFHLTVKFASTYLLAFGAMLLILFKDPLKYRILLIPVLLLFGVRLINKLILFGAVGSSFEVPAARNLLAVAMVAVFFFGILFYRPLPGKE